MKKKRLVFHFTFLETIIKEPFMFYFLMLITDNEIRMAPNPKYALMLSILFDFLCLVQNVLC